MFGREFTGKGHRQHVLPPNPTSYSFEKVGSTKEALGLSGLSVGDEVYWYGGGDDVDTSASGVIVELPAVDPDGRVHSDMAAVEWADEGYEIVEVNNLLNAEHYNIGRGYSQALGSRKQADAYMDELKEWYPVEYDAFMESLGPGTVYEPGELEVIHKKWQQTQDPFDEGGDSMSDDRLSRRKQANAFGELMDFLGDSFSGQPSVADVKEYLQFEKDYPSSNGASVSNLAEELENYFGYDLSEFRTGSRRTASGWKEEYDGTWYIRLPGDVVGFLSPSDDPEVSGTYRASAEVDRPDDSRMLLNVFGVSLEEGKRLVEQAAAQVSASRTASHHLAFFDGIDLPEPQHRVAGWDWDDHLNGFLAAEAAREFTCSCGANVPAPGYTDCHCGKRWNAYTINANGSQKMIAREVPVRDGVVMANRRTAAGTGWETPPVDLGTLSDEELREFVFNVQHAIDSGANIGTIMENKKSHFRDELVRRGWRVDGMGYPYKE